jgi:hypothetical protein
MSSNNSSTSYRTVPDGGSHGAVFNNLGGKNPAESVASAQEIGKKAAPADEALEKVVMTLRAGLRSNS